MTKNVKAADLIGKTIVVGDNQATIVIKSVDGDKLSGEFSKDGKTTPMSFPISQLHGMTEKGLWRIQSEELRVKSEESDTEVTTEADVQEVQDIVPVVTKKPTPKADEPKEEKPVAIVRPMETKPKAEPKPKAKTQTSKGTLTYETYQNKKGKTCAKIIGFKETDKAYVNAADLHGSASWINTKDGKVLYLLFGHRYVEAARLVCEALNAGKSFEDCKAIVDSKPKAETQPSAVSTQPPTEKTYTLDEVAQMLGKLLPEGAASKEDIKKLLLAA